MRVAHVIVDIPAKAIDKHFDYEVPEDEPGPDVGTCVLVTFGNRPVVGYVVGLSEFDPGRELKPLGAVLGGPFFDEVAIAGARWIADEYLCPLSEALRLFLPPGGTPRAVKSAETGEWTLKRPALGPVDDRWATLADGAGGFQPRKGARQQRALLDALAAGPVRVAELAADLGSVDGALKALEGHGAVVIDRRRRLRVASSRSHHAQRHATLSDGQSSALTAIAESLSGGGGVVALDGVTGSGKTEVYLRAIEEAVEAGRSACVLVPEISLTPQTVGRFRSRFGDRVAVLHSRLSPGERFDQWDRVLSGETPIVVGARSALFAPLKRLGLIIIDEEHEGSYKQGSAPRYHAREVARYLACESGATLVLGSASLSMETRRQAESGAYRLVHMPERVTGQQVPPVTVVDMTEEFAAGHRSMFSRHLISALESVRAAKEKAVLFLNRRGFASFLLCRECGHVPNCDACSTSLTYHEVGDRLMCHHCSSTRAVPARCPACGSPYLRQFGAGTQRVEAELSQHFGDWPVVRMDADTTKGKGAHERLLGEFEDLDSGVLLGTQMIAKGLDYPDVTLVGVITADVTLNLPDFRAGERTYQLLEQVAGRAGRGRMPGVVIVQTYWPDHPAIRAAGAHDPALFYGQEASLRKVMGYPPYGRLANVLVRGRDSKAVADEATALAEQLRSGCPDEWALLGPSPAPLSKVKGVWRWHVLIKAPEDADIGGVLRPVLGNHKASAQVSLSVDIDPLDLL